MINAVEYVVGRDIDDVRIVLEPRDAGSKLR